MKNKYQYILLMSLILLISGIYTISYAENVEGYFPPQPKDITVQVSRPNIGVQLILNANTVKEIEMKLNGKLVPAIYDEKQQMVFYKPEKALKAGQYKVDLNIVLEGQKVIKESWKFSVGENAVEELPNPSEEQKKALNYSNRYRKLLGISEFKLNDSLNAAAMAHANYMALNKKFTHDEFANDKGFTGIQAYNRAGVFGYRGSFVSENVSSGSKDYKNAIDSLMDAPYHRLAWINPYLLDLGYGVKDKYYTFDFGGKKVLEDKIVVYPIENQMDVSTSWDGNEIPNPLRFYDQTGNVGYPISLSYFSKKNIEKFTIEKVTLKNSKGRSVEKYLNTPQKDDKLHDSILIIPSKPLERDEKYTVSVKGKIIFQDKKTKEIVKTWSFRTVKEEKNKNEWMKKYIYADVEDHWAQKYILDLSEKGILSAKVNNLYKPDDKITRAEFTEFVVNVLGINTKPYEGIFKDVKKDTNKATYIEAAYRAGIIKGMGDGTFDPNRTIKREEIAVIVMKAYEKKGNKHKINQSPTLSFSDKDDISPWALKDVKLAYELGIIKGYDTGKFAPKNLTTRAEGAVLAKKLLEKIQ
ncbi:S-layer homology domain-containing protein [Crassaminicella profunda]|uniref:CAP and S-layer homology domain-containing protein n=1 Tax=Crassaminicella profunda TaxID=1286698 RepID=UPI001CA60209|nr:S-layer homology domain-containing protein [Crassaminicella profunda]QZY54245.1 S-layer homology domain-containing protein [Crassaminicella profunda]